jgi:hypothetical protein
MQIELEEPYTQQATTQAISDDCGIETLLRAIVGQAARDARQLDTTGQEARRWLLSTDCSEICEVIGLNFKAVREWVNSGCHNWIIRRGKAK